MDLIQAHFIRKHNCFLVDTHEYKDSTLTLTTLEKYNMGFIDATTYNRAPCSLCHHANLGNYRVKHNTKSDKTK